MDHPVSPIAVGFDLLDLRTLARTTTKTCERLAPFALLQNPSSPNVRPAMIKIVEKIKSYLSAIDTSMQVVHIAYEMSKLTAKLWNAHAHTPNTVPLEMKMSRSAARERQKHLEDLVMLADDAHAKAQTTSLVFRQIQQDLYRIAAGTKDMDDTVQIPVDPALPKTIKKSLRVIGSDLVANMNVLAEFSRHSSDLTAWCGWIKTSIIAIDGTVVPPLGIETSIPVDADVIRARWDKVQAACLIYRNMVSETQSRYESMLPNATGLWHPTLQEASPSSVSDNARKNGGKCTGQRQWHRRVVRNWSNLFREAVRQLGSHACN